MMNRNEKLKVVFRTPDGCPQILEIDNIEDVRLILNSVLLTVTKVEEGICAISREKAEQNKEDVNLTHEYDDLNGHHVDVIYGDVVIVGFNEHSGEFAGLTDDEINGMMFSEEDIA